MAYICFLFFGGGGGDLLLKGIYGLRFEGLYSGLEGGGVGWLYWKIFNVITLVARLDNFKLFQPLEADIALIPNFIVMHR